MNTNDVGVAVVGIGAVALCGFIGFIVVNTLGKRNPKLGEGPAFTVFIVIFIVLMLLADNLLS